MTVKTPIAMVPVLLAVLAFSAAPALGAAPEKPEEVTMSPVKATEATFHGFLNPKASEPGKPGTYEFLYKKSPTVCTGGSKAPSSPAISLGGPHEEVSETVTGLEAGATYTVCLLARSGTEKNPANEAVSTPPVTFTTPTPPEVPLTLPVKTFTGTTATFEGEPNPHHVETAGYEFLYTPGNVVCQGSILPAGPEISRPAGTKVSEPVVGLEGSTEYTVCMDASITENGNTEKTASNTVTFKTSPEKPMVELEQSNAESPSAATVEAEVNPENQPTTSCVFEYSQGVEAPKTEPCEQPLGGSGPEIASAKLTGLLPDEAYSYHVIIKNATGKAEGTVEQFTTLTAEKPAVDSETVSAVTPSEATLEAQVNPNNRKVTYTFEYATEAAKIGTAGATTLPGAALKGLGDQTASASTGAALTVGTTYYYRVVVENTEVSGETIDGAIKSFTPLGPPLISTGEAQDVTQTNATVMGSVNPAGTETHYYFAYIEREAYEKALAEKAENPYEHGGLTSETSIPAGFEVKAVGPVGLSNLSPGRTYDYALIASSSPGKNTITANRTFTTSPATPPVLSAISVSNITQSTATISATLNPQNLPTRWELQVGATQGQLQPIASGKTSSTTELSLPVSSLSPDTTYYYKLVVTGPDGTVESPEASFTTSSAPAATSPGLPALGGWGFNPSIAELDAKEAKEDETTTKPLTKAEKLKKALKACKKEKKSKWASCEKAAHKKYPVAKSKKTHKK